MKISVIGAGYVGLVTAAYLGEQGHTINLVEIDKNRRTALTKGECPIYEPGLAESLREMRDDRRLIVTADVLCDAEVVIIAVGTPPLEDWHADLSHVRIALEDAITGAPNATIVIKSTVPPGTTVALQERFGKQFICCPEFLAEGQAMSDARNPSRIVVGCDDKAKALQMAFLMGPDTVHVITDPTSAEMIKYGSNAFLALKISFINEMAHLTEKLGGDISDIACGIGADPRIGTAFLHAGIGFGGSCFPKDVQALDQTSNRIGHSFWMLKAAMEVNALQRSRFVAKVEEYLPGILSKSTVAVLGLTFKPNTDDVRHSAAIAIARELQQRGATVHATDPMGITNAARELPDVTMFDDPYECVQGADAVLLLTEWPQYVDLDWDSVREGVRERIVIDGRNALDRSELQTLGFTYIGIGR